MKVHLERTLRLKVEEKHKSLYRWAINEVDGGGNPSGRDQIPWPWTLHFSAFNISLSDELTLKDATAHSDSGLLTAGLRRTIFAKLRPGRGDEASPWRVPTYSMFGTDRRVDEFTLMVVSNDSESAEESCFVFGSPKYTWDDDFREETTGDWLQFSVKVKPSTFDLYVHRIETGALDTLLFRVNGVDGFYSDWSPSIETSSVKVLTTAKEHAVTLPEGFREPPRLGRVSEASLSVSLQRGLERLPMSPPPAPAPTSTTQAQSLPPVANQSHGQPGVPWFDQPRWILALLGALVFATVFFR